MAVENDILKLKKEIKKLKKDLHIQNKVVESANESVQKMEAFFDNIYEITTILNEENENDRMVN